MRVEAINEPVKMMEIEARNLAMEDAGRREELDRAATEQVDPTGYVWRRRADGGRDGPYCPRHRDSLLIQIDDRYMGMWLLSAGPSSPT